jgi:acetyl esterase/lipase
MSVDYGLVTENRLPAAFDDRLAAVRRYGGCSSRRRTEGTAVPPQGLRVAQPCRFDHVFLTGDSASATIAFHIAAWLGEGQLGGLALWPRAPPREREPS